MPPHALLMPPHASSCPPHEQARGARALRWGAALCAMLHPVIQSKHCMHRPEAPPPGPLPADASGSHASLHRGSSPLRLQPWPHSGHAHTQHPSALSSGMLSCCYQREQSKRDRQQVGAIGRVRRRRLGGSTLGSPSGRGGLASEEHSWAWPGGACPSLLLR